MLGPMTPPRILIALLAAVAVALAGASPAAARPGDKKAATKLLRGTVWTTFESGNVTGATLDRFLTLCRDKRYVYVTRFIAPIIESGSPDIPVEPETRVNGTWRVQRAKLSRNRRFGTIHVRYTTETGETGTVVFSASGRGATLGGVPAQVERTNTC